MVQGDAERAGRALCCCGFCAAGVPAHAQVNFDRPGGDYANIIIRPPVPDPAACATRCERDGRCRAWSFRYPTTDNPNGMCWLKKEVPPRVEDTCCVSGVRGAGVIEPRSKSIEYSTDRYGGDYRHFDTAAEREWRGLQGGVRGRQQVPRLDLSAAGLFRAKSFGALLSEKSRHAAAPAPFAFRAW